MSKLEAAMQAKQGKELTPYEVFRQQMERLRNEVGALVGKENTDRFMRVCFNAVQANPLVLEANRKSLILAALRAAQDRLLPDGREAVFNIYPTKTKVDGREVWIDMVQYLPMVGGLVKKLYESGHVTFVDAVAVRERDGFEYHRGDEPRIIHHPYMGNEDPGPVVAAYCVIKMKNGEVKREVMARRDIELVRSKSKAANGMMWKEEGGFFDQGAIKSVIKRAYKQLPSFYELERAIAADNDATGLPAEQVGTVVTADNGDLEKLVDGRFEQDLRDAAAKGQQAGAGVAVGGGGGGQQSTTSGGNAPPADTTTGGTPAGTADQLAKFTAQMAELEDPEVLAIKRDEANFYKWTDEQRTALDKAYTARRDALLKAAK